MFKKLFTKKDKRTNLERIIESVEEKLRDMDPNTAEYTIANTNLEMLYKTKATDKGLKNRVSRDTIWIVIGNLAGIGLIIWHERADIITTKAINFVLKGRV